MAIEGIKTKIGGIHAYQQQQKIEAPLAQPHNKPASEKANFGELFKDAIREVDTLQKQADSQIEGLVLKKAGVTSHDAMIALEKADMAFQLMNQVRAKIIRAYEEVLRTQV